MIGFESLKVGFTALPKFVDADFSDTFELVGRRYASSFRRKAGFTRSRETVVFRSFSSMVIVFQIVGALCEVRCRVYGWLKDGC